MILQYGVLEMLILRRVRYTWVTVLSPLNVINWRVHYMWVAVVSPL